MAKDRGGDVVTVNERVGGNSMLPPPPASAEDTAVPEAPAAPVASEATEADTLASSIPAPESTHPPSGEWASKD